MNQESEPTPENTPDSPESDIIEAPRDFWGVIKRLGPGLIIAGSIVGSGELIATTKTGAQAGITLLWLIILGCLIKVFVQIELGRYSITHGETTLIALDRVPGPRLKVNWIVWFWLFMMLCTIGQLGGIVGGVGQSLAISAPITGDYRDAIQIPSQKELLRYEAYDPLVLSEWDLELLDLGASGKDRWERLAEHEREWIQSAIERNSALYGRLTGEEKQDIGEAADRIQTLQENRPESSSALTSPSEELIAARAEFQALVASINDRLITESKQESETLGFLQKMTPAQRERALRGHAILAARLSDVDRDADRGIAAMAAATESSGQFVSVAIEPATKDDKIWAGVGAALTIALLWLGRYRMLQNISTVLVVAFTFVTIGNVVSLQMTEQWSISLQQFIHGLSFDLPEPVPGEADPVMTALATFGIIGVGATELITYPYWCLEKGYAKWTGPRSEDESWAKRAKGWLRVMLCDAFLSMAVYTIATIAFYIMGVAVLFNEGRDPDGMRMVSTLASAYVPVFGAYAGWLFLLGAIAVLYSTFLVANAGNARMYTDGCKVFGIIGRDNPKSHDRALLFFSFLVPFLSFSMYLTGANPVTLVLISGMAQAVMLPMIGIGSIFFRYRMTDERLKPSPLWDVMLIASCLGLLITGIWGVVSRL